MNKSSDDYTKLDAWLESGEFLPEFMRDFHDQKDLFKAIHKLYGSDLSWVGAHVYTVDRFLWYMASRGYVLRKSRRKIDFRPLLDHYEFVRDQDQSPIKIKCIKTETNSDLDVNQSMGVTDFNLYTSSREDMERLDHGVQFRIDESEMVDK